METEISAARMGIVVVNYGSHRLIEANLGSIDLSRLDVEVVIVDNFSSLEERSAIEHVASSRSWSLVNLARNEGFGAGANAGLRVAADAGCASFLVLNPDADVQVEVVDELQQHCLRDRYALVTPILVTSAGEIAFDGSQVYLDTGRIKRVRRPDGAGSRGEVISDRLLGDGRPARAWLPGTCLALHRDLLSKAGGFDEPYFLYWEDVDLSFRCQDAGGSLVIRHDLAVVHDEGGTQQRPGGRALSQRYYYWNCRNRLLFAARHLPTRQVVRWMLHTPSESWQIVLRGGRRQLLHSPAPLVAAVRGSLAGLMIAACAVFGRRPSMRSYPVI